MTIMGSEQQNPVSADEKPEIKVAESPKIEEVDSENLEKHENIFSDDNLPKDSTVEDVTVGTVKRAVTIESEDKVSFIDSIVNNTRYTRDYSLFGGKIAMTLRSLTNDEVNALSAWIAKQGSSDPAGLLSGRYRKYLVAAQMARFNGTDMPPLEEPLFETLKKDGKTIDPPGWIERCSYWDNVPTGLFSAIMGCIEDFDARYAVLCQKANDVNFWSPDTP